MTERSADQIVEVNFLTKALDFIDHALRTSMNHHGVDVPSQEILVAAASLGIDVGPEQPLRALTGDIGGFRVGWSDRKQSRHWNFTAVDGISMPFQLLSV